jgi:hypothetical protein
VSFYYCFAPDGRTLETIVAEVSNTPWGERHMYVLPEASNLGRATPSATSSRRRSTCRPFSAMDMDYGWRFGTPGERLWVHMENMQKGERVFEATLSLRKRRADDRPGARRALVLRPAMTLQVVVAIYFQALRLWLGRATFYSHPRTRAPRHHESRERLIALTYPCSRSRSLARAPRSLFDDAIRGSVFGLFGPARTRVGHGRRREASASRSDGPVKGSSATITVRDPAAYRAILFGGSVGAGEAYMKGHWTCDDLASLARILARNIDVLDAMDSGRRGSPARRRAHRGFRRGATRAPAAAATSRSTTISRTSSSPLPRRVDDVLERASSSGDGRPSKRRRSRSSTASARSSS